MILKPKYQLNSILTVIFFSIFLAVTGQEVSRSFNFNQISETEFKTAFESNFNANPVQTIDSTRLEKAQQIIDKSYTQQEIDLAAKELCKSPRCLTNFYGYYTNLDILVFLIQEYHFENAVFLKDNEGFPKKWINRFNGSYGVMSKSGIWVGLERQDADNYLQIEICQITERGAWTILEFDFKTIDINSDEKEPVFWVNENTIYIATIEFNKTKNEGQKKFYEIEFEY
jgi:AraC-like DNA-binding protein